MTQDFLKARVKRGTVPRLYRLIAPFHDGLALIVESKARSVQFELAQVTDGQDILEVAVGTGLNFQTIVRSNPSGTNVGVDITPAMIRKTNRRMHRLGLANYDLAIDDAYSLSFADNSFDLIVNSYMFDLLSREDMCVVLSEFARVLRPGGRLVLTYMTPGNSGLEKFWDSLYRIHPFILGGCRGVNAIPYLEKCGFDLVESRRVTFRTFPSEVVLAEANSRRVQAT